MELQDQIKAKFPEAEIVEVGRGLSVKVPLSQIHDLAQFVRDALGYSYLSCLEGTDMKDHLEIVLHACRVDATQVGSVDLTLKADVAREGGVVPTFTDLWPTANWHERETYDMYGMRFSGHPNMKRILLPDNWQGGYPLLKDFVDKRPKRPRLVRQRFQ